MTSLSGSSQLDRLNGVNDGVAIKAPVRCATTGPITLSGLQTIDGVSVVGGDRVLVKDQSDNTLNGIYDVSTGTWTRSIDCDGNRDLVRGTSVNITDGTTQAGTQWSVSGTNPITIGSSAITFTRLATTWVSSVGLTMPAEFSVASSPITASGSIVVSKATETANKVWAGPTTGSAAAPAFRSLVEADLPANARTAGIAFVIDGVGSAIGTGVHGDMYVPFDFLIQSVTLLADQAGDIVVDLWAADFGSYPPTVANTITAGAVPTISSGTNYQDATLTGWTTVLSLGNTIRYNVNSCTTITRCTIILKGLKT